MRIRISRLLIKIIKEVIVIFLLWLVVFVYLVANSKPLPTVVWVAVVPFGYFLSLINLYWLIPLFDKHTKKLGAYCAELLAAIVILSFPFILISLSSGIISIRLISFLFFLMSLISVAVSWYLYTKNKERFEELASLKSALGKSDAELKLLQAQINPHFLFNALNTLYGLSISENAIRTSDGIQRLGDMMRFMLRDNQKDRIPLENEISYLKNYIYLQQLRMENSENTDSDIHIEEPSDEYFIVPMILIPFVENAFKHGVRLHEKSWIYLYLHYENPFLFLEVRNSLHYPIRENTEKYNNGIGLENVKERLKLLYHDKYELKISKENSEFIVHLKLNL